MPNALPTTLPAQIDFFFAPPLPAQPVGKVSPLHLLRREAQDCLLGDVVPEDRVLTDPRERHRLFATMMVVMAGIDLLAKFYAGSDSTRGVGKRIKKFASTFMFADGPTPEEFADVLYIGCRNPLLHSFTLHQKQYRVALVERGTAGAIWRHRGSFGVYMIDVGGVFEAFVKAVRVYEAALRTEPALQVNFEKMFGSYGSLNVQGVPVTRPRGKE